MPSPAYTMLQNEGAVAPSLTKRLVAKSDLEQLCTYAFKADLAVQDSKYHGNGSDSVEDPLDCGAKVQAYLKFSPSAHRGRPGARQLLSYEVRFRGNGGAAGRSTARGWSRGLGEGLASEAPRRQPWAI
jgi:hypothetical protein